MSKYSVTFLDTSSQKVPRVHVSDQGICVRDIVEYVFANDKGRVGELKVQDMSKPFHPADDATIMCADMGLTGLELLLVSKSLIDDDLDPC